MSNFCECSHPSDVFNKVCGRCLLPLGKIYADNSPREFPFEEYAWDDDPSNNNTWVDGAEAKSAYLSVKQKCEQLEGENKKLSEELFWDEECQRLREQVKILREGIDATIWNFNNDCGRAGVEFLKEAIAKAAAIEGEKSECE
jgi:hypothetical protein